MGRVESIQFEMAEIVRLAAEPVGAGEPVKAWLARSAKRLGLDWGMAKRLLYREVQAVPAHVADELRERRARLLEAKLRRIEHEAALLRAELRAPGAAPEAAPGAAPR